MPQNLIFLGLMIAVFYLMLIRPQQRRLKQHQQLLAAIQPGDEVVTIGGVFGYVKTVDDAVITLEISPGTVIRVSRQAVSKRITPEEQAGLEVAGPEESEGG